MENNLRIKSFADMQQFEKIMMNWAKATGLATVAVGSDGRYISDCYNFTDFCIKYTRGSREGCRRCEHCDRTGKGVYYCHAGLIDFSIDLVVNGQKLGAIIGGQVLPDNPDEEKFRKVAREIDVDEDEYIEALKNVNVRSEEVINASAELLGDMLNSFINAEYNAKHNTILIKKLTEGVEECESCVNKITRCTRELDGLQRRQQILALNARIEAARVGDAGRGFAVVADNVGSLSVEYNKLSADISKNVTEIEQVVKNMAEQEINNIQKLA